MSPSTGWSRAAQGSLAHLPDVRLLCREGGKSPLHEDNLGKKKGCKNILRPNAKCSDLPAS